MRKLHVAITLIGAVFALPVATALVAPAFVSDRVQIDAPRLEAAATAHANFSLEQQLAVRAELQSQLHPDWKGMSWLQIAGRIAVAVNRMVNASLSAAVTTQGAAFRGNQGLIAVPSSTAIALQRQADCSLTLFSGSFTVTPAMSFQSTATTANYQNILHDSAGLTTTAGVVMSCPETNSGIGNRTGFYLGKTASGAGMFAATATDLTRSTTNNALYYGTASSSTLAVQTQQIETSMPGMSGITVGDLNGDGIADVVGIDATTGRIGVWLANSSGTLGAPAFYALPGSVTEAAVTADFNGDGKVDVVAASQTSAGQEEISILLGNGTGLLSAAQSFAVSTPTVNSTRFPLSRLVAGHFRNTAAWDIVGSNGLVLLNSGSGTFTAAAAGAFAPVSGTSSESPNLAAGDFNNDAKADLAVSNGVTIWIFLSSGDGSFTAGRSYASIDSVGYLSARDLDNDGNVDLFVGVGNGGYYGGDKFEAGRAYALMGNGDGSFQGAPALPFVYTGNNVEDLNGDGKLDAVGVNADMSFSSWLGDGTGQFSAHSTLASSPVTVGGVSYPLQNIDSFATGDVNGDGIPDLLYIAPTLNGIPDGSGGTGVFIALGNGQGGFGAPTFVAVPAVSSTITGAFTIYPTLSNLHLADVNHDGKVDLTYYYTYSYQNTSNVNSTDAGTAIQLGNGNGAFQAPHQLVFYTGPNILANQTGGFSNGIPNNQLVAVTADLNHDGNTDLIFLTRATTIDSTLSTRPASIQVALGHGDGTFAAPANVTGPDLMVDSISGGAPSLTLADMNGDGVPDMVALGSSSTYRAQIAVVIGNGDGTFRAPNLLSTNAQYLNNSQGIAVADFDGDGKADVAVTDPYDPAGSGLFIGNGDGTLQSGAGTNGATPGFAINLLVGGPAGAFDVNADGLPDLVAGSVELLGQHQSVTATPSFSLSTAATQASVTAGQAATTTVTLSPTGGFTGVVSLSCSGLPAGASCGFAPASVNVNGSAGTSTLTIATTARSAMNIAPSLPGPLTPALSSGGSLLANLPSPWLPTGYIMAALLALLARRRWSAAVPRRSQMLRGRQLLALALCSAAVLSACGGGSNGGAGTSSSGSSSSSSSSSSGGAATGTPAGNYAITVTGTSGATSHSATYTLTVQ